MDKPRAELACNTAEFETLPLVRPTGFREYDARWLYPEEINLIGVRYLGHGIGTQLRRLGRERPRILVGHDYRSYSLSIKQALVIGLMAAGCEVHDIGLCTSPMAYFTALHLGIPACAMVTASHNENGWTGVKIGTDMPLTHGPDEMAALKRIVLAADFDLPGGGSYVAVDNARAAYLDELTDGIRLARPLKVVAAAGNGTAGLFAPEAFRRIGCEVVELDCEPDWTFPRYNPNPEDMKMLHAVRDAVLAEGADVGLAFDGDGDRCGVVDDTGEELFSDKVGFLLARRFAKENPGASFVVDVKSTGIFADDPVLNEHGATVEYWKTGHSYMKRRVNETGALAGFEKSGHFFFNAPLGMGYDDGLKSGIEVCRLLDAENARLSELRKAMPVTWQSPTIGAHCPDERKYEVVERITREYRAAYEAGEPVAEQKIAEIVDVNGVRFRLADGSWGLVRASSNKPSLVIVVESPVSEAVMRAVFGDIHARLQATGEVGAYDQSF
jgi:phosphomannomutase/phosphoglucomutase